MKKLLLLIILISCKNIPPAISYPPPPEEEYTQETVFEAQELATNLNEIQRETGWSKIPTSEEITEHLNEKLTMQYDCEQVTMHEPETDDLLEDIQAQTEPELGEFETIEEKIKQNFTALGGSSEAIEQSLCFFNKYKSQSFYQKINGRLTGETKINNHDYMVVQDFTLPSSQKRFFMINLKTGAIDVMFSSHGMGRPQDHRSYQGENSALKAEYFSNDAGTNLTPRGFMISGSRGVSSLGWKWNMQLDGVQTGLNDNNRDRLIYFHPGVSSDGERRLTWPGRAHSSEDNPNLLGWSEKLNRPVDYPQMMTYGCTAVAEEYAEEVYDKTKGGALYYNFTQAEKDLGPNFCGGDNLLLKD